MFPVPEQKYLAKHITNANYEEIDSEYGHDGFLIETSKLTNVISEYYAKEKIKKDKLNLQKTNN